ncbi:hypothetical protein CsSME_00030738 [Camellia sinensis var. sinensis]
MNLVTKSLGFAILCSSFLHTLFFIPNSIELYKHNSSMHIVLGLQTKFKRNPFGDSEHVRCVTQRRNRRRQGQRLRVHPKELFL